MKKQVITLAAMMIASNVAMAFDSSQGGSTATFNSMESILNKVASTSGATVNASTSTGEKITDIRKAVNTEATAAFRKSGPVSSAIGVVEALGAFSIQAIEIPLESGSKVTKFVLEGSVKGTRIVLDVTEKYVAMPIAKGADSTAQATVDGAKYVGRKTVQGAEALGRGVKSVASTSYHVGQGVLVGVLASGKVVMQGTKAASHQSVDSHSIDSTATLLGSTSASADAFGSKVVEGYRK